MRLPKPFDHKNLKNHLLISLIGLILGVLLYYYFSSDSVEKAFGFGEATLSGALGIIISFLIYFISRKLDQYIPWKTNLLARIFAGLVSEFTIAFLIINSAFYLYIQVFGSIAPEVYQSGLIKLAIILFILIFVYNIIYFALYSYYSYARVQIEAVKFERKQIDLQLKALKSHLSAHFLFNNLNTISSLAYKDAKTAEKFIRGLANLYNYTLNSYHSKLVFLDEELSIVQFYLFLLKTQYGPNINCRIDIQKEALKSKIPPLTLQMLLENTVKHNVMDAQNALQIDVYSDEENITVKNNITKAPKNLNSFNIGLKNIESRYQLIHKQGISISNNTHFIVKLPIIK